MRRTSARFRLAGFAAIATAVATLAGFTAINGATASAAEEADTYVVGTPAGYGRSTTGGAGGSVVTVSNATDFINYAKSSSTLEIRVNGTINLSSMTKVASNKTIIGVGTSGRITGSGLNVANANNVILQNLTLSGSNDDAINVQYSTNVWIDHNTITGANDGGIDIKRASDNITVSWNRMYDQDKNMLLGHDDGNGSEDRGRLHVSYHHNWFDGTNQRNPRVRFGNVVHVFNNYYDGVGSYGVASTEEAGVLVEGNYFENTDDPYHCGEGDSDPGNLRATNNYFTGSGSGQTCGSVGGVPYSYSLDSASSVKNNVMNGAGVGRI
ncbi:right-handed parallel beta-helix repeat-containing protein [Streptomyces sp. B6B3]|uniref:pectate lyase family protein n=1 Tax=Streptomyces sp. B6B3 TaxID=3153570 RepID=UPI00325DA926